MPNTEIIKSNNYTLDFLQDKIYLIFLKDVYYPVFKEQLLRDNNSWKLNRKIKLIQ